MRESRADKAYTELAGLITTGFDGINERFDGINERLDTVEKRLDAVENQIAQVKDDVETIGSTFGFVRNGSGKLSRPI